MKKKLCCSLLASACALTCVFALSACDKNQATETKTVNETQWSNVFSKTYDKFALSYTVKEENGEDGPSVIYKFDFVNKYFYMAYSEGETEFQEIYTDEGNNKGYNYAISGDMTEWVRGSYTIDSDTGFMFNSKNEYYGYINLLKDKFSQFDYDEASEKYVCGTFKIDEEFGTAENIYVSFEKGELKCVEFKNVVNTFMECSYVFAFEDFKIEIPEHFSEDI